MQTNNIFYVFFLIKGYKYVNGNFGKLLGTKKRLKKTLYYTIL